MWSTGRSTRPCFGDKSPKRKSGDKSPHSKAVAGQERPSFELPPVLPFRKGERLDRRREIFLLNLFLALLLIAPLASQAQTIDGVLSGANEDLKKASAELAAVRQEIEVERLPLARQVTELELKLINRRAELAKAQRSQENQLVELNGWYAAQWRYQQLEASLDAAT